MAPVTMGQGRGIGLTPIKAAGRGAPAGRRARLVAGALADPAALPVCPLVEDHVAQATARILQKGDETGRLETLRAQFPDRGPVEQVAGLDTASQIVGRQRVRPGEAVIQADLVLERRVVVDVLHDE